MIISKKLSYFVFIFLSIITISPLLSAPMALLLGVMFINIFRLEIPNLSKYTSTILQYSIVGLGFGINFSDALEAGSSGFLFTISSIILIFIIGLLLGKIFKIEKKIRDLIFVGTAICGGSAIAAISPIIRAENRQNSVALGVVFLLNTISLFIFPYLGECLEMSQKQFGTWVAIAIHDTSSVVGAASKFGEEALEIATSVKLARALFIIPIAFIFSTVYKKEKKVHIPIFILFFIIAIILNTYLPLLENISPIIFGISKTSLKLALFLVGIGLSYQKFREIGLKPLILGAILWVMISVFSYWGVMNFL